VKYRTQCGAASRCHPSGRLISLSWLSVIIVHLSGTLLYTNIIATYMPQLCFLMVPTLESAPDRVDIFIKALELGETEPPRLPNAQIVAANICFEDDVLRSLSTTFPPGEFVGSFRIPISRLDQAVEVLLAS
jgi:hypothetical protein